MQKFGEIALFNILELLYCEDELFSDVAEILSCEEFESVSAVPKLFDKATPLADVSMVSVGDNATLAANEPELLGGENSFLVSIFSAAGSWLLVVAGLTKVSGDASLACFLLGG